MEQIITPLSCELVEKSGAVLFVAGSRLAAGEVPAVELTDHPFFVLTLYQPEPVALEGRAHPLVNGFVAAARSNAGGGR